MQPIFLYNPKVVQFDYGTTHPFRLERLWLTRHICAAMGLLDGHVGVERTFEPAEEGALRAAHESTYLDLLHAASDGLPTPELARHGLGSGDNPVFSGLWEYALYTAGGSLTGAAILLSGEARRVFHAGGGLHHAMQSRASGFCYINDVVLAIRHLVEQGRRVLYLDVDAHHGDGVQDAFYDTNRVMTVSIHQDGRTLFPGSGFVQELGRGEGVGYAVNIPLLPHMGDDEYARVLAEIVHPLFTAYAPDVLVTELGADPILGDPLTNMELSLSGWWHLVSEIAAWDVPWLAVGGGGYDLANAMRAWSLAWVAMVDAPRPERLPDPPPDLPGLAKRMRWPTDFWNAPVRMSAHSPEEAAINAIIEQVRAMIFHHHGL